MLSNDVTSLVLNSWAQGCGNTKILYLSGDKHTDRLYLSKHKFTCPEKKSYMIQFDKGYFCSVIFKNNIFLKCDNEQKNRAQLFNTKDVVNVSLKFQMLISD